MSEEPTKDDLAEVAANTLMYKCIHCGMGGLSRDDVQSFCDSEGFTHFICAYVLAG